MILEDDRHCFVCGALNDAGLKLQFQIDKKTKTITTEFTPQKVHQGFRDIVHGGIIGLILDECMVNLTWKLGLNAVSAEYTVRLRNPAIVGKKLIFSARIVSEKTRILVAKGECKDENGKQIASSLSKCIRV